MNERAVRPATWPEVALAVVPGVLATLAAALPGMPIALFLGTVICVAVVGILLVAQRRVTAAFPVWGLVPLGLLIFGAIMWPMGLLAGSEQITLLAGAVGMLVVAGWVFWRERPGRPPLVSIALAAVALAIGLLQWALPGGGFGAINDFRLWLALPIAVGLLLAPTHGLPAALVLIYFGTFLMSFHVEHVIYFQDAPAWSDGIRTAMPILFMTVLPAGVLRARTDARQAVGLLAPVALYWLLLVVGLATASAVAPDWRHALSIARPVVDLFVLLALCGAVFGWLQRGEERLEALSPAEVSPAAEAG